MSIKRDSVYNLAGGLFPSVVAFLSIPYLLENLGNLRFGVLTIIWTLVGFANLFDMGVSRSLTYEISKAIRENTCEISSTIAAGLLIAILAGILGTTVVLIGSASFTDHWLTVAPDVRHEVYASIVIISLAVVPVTVNTVARGVLEGAARFGASNINRSIVGTSMFVLPVVAVAFQDNRLETVCYYLLFGRIAIAAFSLGQIWREMTGAQYRVAYRETTICKHLAAKIRQLLSYGVWIMITGAVGPLMTSGDRLIVAKYISVELLPVYTIPSEILQKLLLLPAALCGALFPRMAKANKTDALALHAKYNRIIAIGMALVCGIAGLASYPLLSWWISEPFASKAQPIAIVICLGVWINSLAQAPYTLLHAAGYPKLTAIFHVIELLLYIPVLIYFVEAFGLIGAAYAWVLRAVLDLIFLRAAVLLCGR